MYIFLFLDWTHGKEEEEANINPWEDNWDDDIAEEDFSIQLRYVNLVLTLAV